VEVSVPVRNRIVKFLAWALVLLSLTLLIGRQQVYLGSALYLLRWPLVFIGCFTVWLLFRQHNRFLCSLVLVCVLLLLGQLALQQYRKYSLPPATGQQQLRLMSYNVLFSNKQPQGVLNLIDSLQPDVLAMQEFTPQWQRLFEQQLGSQYPYRQLRVANHPFGSAVYSKFPLNDQKLLPLQGNYTFCHQTNISLNSKVLHLYNTHLSSPAKVLKADNPIVAFSRNYRVREKQLRQIEQLAKEDTGPQLLLGDLNTMPMEPLHRQLEHKWTDLYGIAGEGFGFTWPNINKAPPFVRLDYMYGRGAIEVKSIEVIKAGTSDHLPLLVEIML
jgi:vancomycin resistance protein VanJ